MSVAAAADDRADDTIYALSSGQLPAAIAVMRVSGPAADDVLHAVIGTLPEPRRASLRTVRDGEGDPIDRALVLRFPGPDTATGEDLAEFHFHGSRAVVAAASRTFAALGCRAAEPGEFTRRALLAGRIDLAETEALADLLEAETELQRRAALGRSAGTTTNGARAWATRLTALVATVEHLIEYDDDDGDPAAVRTMIRDTREAIDAALAAPAVDRIRDGIRVALAGPPNAGKSSLFNRLLDADVAIVSPVPGTTRDVNERAIAIDGIPFILIDTAGIHDAGDAIERDGIERARATIAGADIVLDLADSTSFTGERIPVAAQCDHVPPTAGRIATSARTGQGISDLLRAIVEAGRDVVRNAEGSLLRLRERSCLVEARDILAATDACADIGILAEQVRAAERKFAETTTYEATDAMLTALFARFCVGK